MVSSEASQCSSVQYADFHLLVLNSLLHQSGPLLFFSPENKLPVGMGYASPIAPYTSLLCGSS